MIRVLLADDQVLVRAGLAMILDAESDVQVVGEAGDGATAVDLATSLHPDVVLMDLRMPGTDGLAATRAIATDGDLTGTRVLILSTFDVDEDVFEALRCGASGYLLKHSQPVDLVRAVREVAAGHALLSPSVTRRLITAFVARRPPGAPTPPPLRVLTARESEVVALAAYGLSNQEIAAELVVSAATVRTHIGRAMVKLHARDRAQLVAFAYRSGLVTGCEPVEVAVRRTGAPGTQICVHR